MTNIYNKDILDRNSIQSVPSGYIDGAANDLFRFLGNFWRNIHLGGDFIKGIQKVRGIKLAQFYLDILESLKLQDRDGMPVFHRELWKPLIIRRSQRNTAQENVLKVGSDIYLGKQPPTSKYGPVDLFLGKLANFEDYVTYPVESDMVAIVSGITDNVINPKIVWQVGEGKDVVFVNGTLIIPKDQDPFGPNSKFEVYDVVNDSNSGLSPDKEYDQETVLWASDVLIDKSYITDHMSYALGVSCPSSDITKRIINANWDAVNCGLTPALLRSILASMLNIPVVQEEVETITKVIDTSTEKKVYTDKHSYSIYPKAKLRECIKAGAELHRGDLIDQSLKIYPVLTDISEEKIAGTSEYADIFKTDVPVITMPKTILRTNTVNGLSVDWEPKDVLTAGKDVNGNEKLYFEIGGSEEDVDAFWEDVWAEAERTNTDLSKFFEQYDDGESSDDVWRVVPAEFFLKYMIGGNTVIITVDRNQIDDMSIIRDSVFFNLLNSVMPSGMRMFFIEHLSVDEDEYDFKDRADDEAEKYAYDEVDDEMYYMDLPGMRGKNYPSYDDEVEMKFFRNRKRRAE